jgi:hypothetical protein
VSQYLWWPRRQGKTATEIYNDALRRAYDADMSRVMGPIIQREIDKNILQAMTFGTSVLYVDKSGVKHIGYDEMAKIDQKVWNQLSKETPVTTKKAKPEKFNTIGVRFLDGGNLAKIYTYKVRIGAKVHLGQELVADTPRGPAVVVVVRTDKTPNEHETYPIEGLKYISKKAVAL